MAQEPDIRRIQTDLSNWNWELPAAARQRLDALAQLADTDRLGSATPLPAAQRLKILAGLLGHLLPDGTSAALPETCEMLSSRQRAQLANLIYRARRDLDKAQAKAPATLLGFPPDTRGIWANLLTSSWIPMQPGWMARLRE